jgi:hypothetical protein
MAIALAPPADGPLCLPMAVLQAADMSKVPHEHEKALRRLLFRPSGAA